MQYSGMFDAFRKTVAKKGLRGLYKGLAANSLKLVSFVTIVMIAENMMKDVPR